MSSITNDVLYAALKLHAHKKCLIKLHDRVPTSDLDNLLKKNPDEIRKMNGIYQGCRGEILTDETLDDRLLFFNAVADAIENYQKKGLTKKLRRRMLKELILSGLQTDGAHHKQWYLEQIAKLLDIKLKKGSYEPGVP